MAIDDSMKVSIQETLDGFRVTTDIFGETTRRFVNVRAAIEEQATRNALIRMGWTPPVDRDGDEAVFVESFWMLTKDGPVYSRHCEADAPEWVRQARIGWAGPITTNPDTRSGSEGQGA